MTRTAQTHDTRHTTHTTHDTVKLYRCDDPPVAAQVLVVQVLVVHRSRPLTSVARP